jgi:hypothetical protein
MTAFARKVLAALPDTTSGGNTNNYTTLQEFTADYDKANGKVDFQASPTLSLFGRYGFRNLDTFDQPNIPLPSGGAGNGAIYARNKQAVFGATWTPSGSSLLEARLGYSNTRAGKNPPGLGGDSALAQFGLPGLPDDPRISGGLPTILIGGYSDLGRQATNPQWQYPTIYNPKINYTWTRKAHSFKGGYEYQHIATEVQDVNPLYGRDTYNGTFTRPAGAAASNLYNLADFALGLRAQYALSSVLVAHLRRDMHFAYLQDDWRANRKLTLNIGLRYEYSTPYWEEDNILSNYDPATNSIVRAKDGSLADRALINPDRNNFGPRLGFAYTVTNGTVVRGGYGISYVHFSRAGGGDLLPINGPQVVNAVVNQIDPTAASFVPAERGYPAGLADPAQFNPLTANITYMPRDFHSSPVQSWYISLQREVRRNMLLDVAYVGNRADDLVLFANSNQAVPNNAAGTLSLQSRRPNQQFADITFPFNGGKSRYQALQTKFEWRVSRDVTVLSALTLSKAKDNGSQSLENANGNFPAPQDFRNLDADYGTSEYDQPVNSTTSFVWTLPFGRGQRWASGASPVLDAIVGGWRLAGINRVNSGEPVTFTYAPGATFLVSGITQDFRGANNYRANVTCDPYAQGDAQTINNWFNRDCVSVPTDPSQPFGNAKRNTVRGPVFWQLDTALAKTFALGGPAKFEFRLEAFNLLNRTNFRAPSGVRSAGAFGTITSTLDPRQLQLGFKFLW